MSLSDNMGDAIEAVAPIMKHFKLDVNEDLHEQLVAKKLYPNWAKDDYET